METQIAETHRQRQQQLWDRYDQGVQSGEYYAFGYPYGYLILIIILGYLAIPANKNGRNYGRFVAWLLALLECFYMIAYTRSRYPVANAFTGLCHSWLALWVTAHFLVNDPKASYYRIKKLGISKEKVHDRDEAIATTTSHDLEFSKRQSNEAGIPDNIDDGSDVSQISYVWEPHPQTSWRARLDWAVDLLSTFDGIGWSWGIRSLPKPPENVKTSLVQSNTKLNLPIYLIWEKSRASIVRARHQFKSALLLKFVITYIILDVVKTLMSLDPYFWGYTDHPSPPYIPVSWQQSPVMSKSCRLAVAQFATYFAVTMVLGLKPLYYMFVHNEATLGVKEETWMYPDDFGPYSSVGKFGLAGFWSIFWHQSFRYVFEAPAILVIRNTTIDPKSFNARVIRIFGSFFSSAFMHFSLSYSSIGPSRPFRGSFVFFMLQPFGILAQYYWIQWFQTSALSKSCPHWGGFAANIIYVNIWLYFTAPLFIEDAARGGWFMFEPIPISIFRGFGFGAKDDGWWTLHGRFATWRFDGWRSGIVT